MRTQLQIYENDKIVSTDPFEVFRFIFTLRLENDLAFFCFVTDSPLSKFSVGIISSVI